MLRGGQKISGNFWGSFRWEFIEFEYYLSYNKGIDWRIY